MLQAARTMPDTLAHPAAADARPDLIVVQGVSKRFGSTAALQDVSLRGRAGSIHAITGENGAGKSTLMKLLAGVHQPDAGEIRMAGQRLQLRSPAAARAAGISTVFQELTVLPNLTVAENLVLGREPRRAGLLDHAAIHAEAQAVLSRIGITLDPQRSGASLTVGEQQLVEIAKGVSTDAQVFIFDEPTAPLNRAEVDKLEQLLHALKAQDKLVFYISHRLDEIFRLCDTVSVLKDGRWVATEPIGALTSERLITLMVGRELQALFPPRASTPPGVAALDVRSLTPLAGGASARLQLRRGEIVGLGGLEGQGQREIVRALAGALPPAACDVQRLGRDGQPQAYDPRQGVAHMAAAKQGHGRARALQPGRQAAGVRRAQSLKPQVHHAAAALAQGGAQGVAHLRLARLTLQAAARIGHGLVLQMAPANGANHAVGQHRHPGPGFPWGRAFGRLHTHQPRGCAVVQRGRQQTYIRHIGPFTLKVACGSAACIH